MSQNTKLTSQTETRTRFSEVDSMGVVWHGNYVKYLEDGRETFGSKYGISYFDVFDNGLMTPIVKLEIDYKRMVKYGESMLIDIEYIYTEAAKIIFNYTIRNAATKEIAITATTIQVFINIDGELQLTKPDFYINWQKKMGLI